MNIDSKVMTTHGAGTIRGKDYVKDAGEFVWTGRWGVLHDVYPEEKPVGMYTGDLLYYMEEDLEEL